VDVVEIGGQTGVMGAVYKASFCSSLYFLSAAVIRPKLMSNIWYLRDTAWYWLQVKPLGVLAMIDDGELDWKIIAIDVNDPKASSVNDIEDVER